MIRKIAGVALLILLIFSQSIFLFVQGRSLTEIGLAFLALLLGTFLGIAGVVLAFWLIQGGKRA